MARVRSIFLKIAGYTIPFVQSLPPLGVWTGLMTLPFASYLVMFFAGFPLSLSEAVSSFFKPFLIAEKVLVVAGFIILSYSLVYLFPRRKKGLTTSRLFGVIRHPQYLGIILMTLGLTSWSYYELTNFFGVGFLGPLETVGVWFGELFAYIGLAYAEELYLSKSHGESFENYKDHVPFLIPFIKSKRGVEILVAILVPAFILSLLIFFQPIIQVFS